MSTGTISVILNTYPEVPIFLDTYPEIPVDLEYTVVVTPAFYIDEAGDLYVNEAGDLYHG